ncbi:hypothetical protein WISP_09380 [Willisornis vidua]|uniref:Uncharacterized protein n=1 Tax=Willisornis vidua TaxID=1566151 RepID=A0ABQ9DRT4_9PASS|nr:hypothetical protein WISP_09380 [Willisornis vidua]
MVKELENMTYEEQMELRNVTWECRDSIKEVNAQLKLTLARDIESNKKIFIDMSTNKRLNNENVSLLLDRQSSDNRLALELNAFSTFIRESPRLRGRVLENLPATHED